MPRRSAPNPAADRYLRRRRVARIGVPAVLVLLALSVLLDHLGLFGYTDDANIFDRQTYLVQHVIDGDTVRVTPPSGGDPTPVRLLGIDAPELRPDGSAPPDHWAAESADYLRQRLEGRPVFIQIQRPQSRDRYGRLLAYLYLDDSTNVNEELVRLGHAYAHRRFDHPLRGAFEQAESAAQRKKLGLWKDVREEQMPPWRRAWLASRRSTDAGD